VNQVEVALKESSECLHNQQKEIQAYKASLMELETWIFETQNMFSAKLLLLRDFPKDNLFKEV